MDIPFVDETVTRNWSVVPSVTALGMQKPAVMVKPSGPGSTCQQRPVAVESVET